MTSRLFLALSLALATFACGAVHDDPGDDGGVDATIDAPTGTPAFTITATTPRPAVPFGGMNLVAVQVTRTGGFAGDVTVTGLTPPAGLTVTGVTIPAAATTGGVLVSAAAPLTIGATVTFTLQATGVDVAEQRVDLTAVPVTGRPGSLDTSFGPGATGVTTVSLGNDDNGAFAALDVINGAVFATGTSVGGLGATRFTSMRFTADGAADPTWNGGALVRTTFTGSSGEAGFAVATGRQTDGRSVVLGEHLNGGADVAAARYSITGGGGGVNFGDGTGKSLVNLGGEERVTDGVVLASNQLVVVGARDGQLMVARLTSAGLLDTTFNAPAGYTVANLGASSRADAVAVDGQDRLVVAGTFDAGGQGNLVIRRYAPAGALDGTFGGNTGVVVAGPADEATLGLAVVGDQIVVASSAVTNLGLRLRVRRFTSDGTLDATFGDAGVAEFVPAATQALVGRDLAVLPDGRIVLLADDGGVALLVRFTAAGAIDPLFGNQGDGTASINIGDNGLPVCLRVYADHLLLVGGGNQGGTPGPGTFAVVARAWM